MLLGDVECGLILQSGFAMDLSSGYLGLVGKYIIIYVPLLL